MTWTEFKKKWHHYKGKEASACQEHFNDLCRLLGHATPVESDPSGTDFFCFQKGTAKDAEADAKFFPDAWKKGCFGWEYKGKHQSLDEAYNHLLRCRESLINPPLLVVCDFDHYIVRTNFHGAVRTEHEFTNDEINHPDNLRILRAIFTEPDSIKPPITTAQVTENLAQTFAGVAKSLQSRDAVELAGEQLRSEKNFAGQKNVRIARFLNRIAFCFFAEATGLLPKNLFSDVLKSGLSDLKHLARTLENLFTVMARGGAFGKDKIRQFDGCLFGEPTVFELTESELRDLEAAAGADWQFIQPGIMGTLFERALDEGKRSGPRHANEADIKALVEPALMASLRREWEEIKQSGWKLSAPAAKPRAHAFPPPNLPAPARLKLKEALEQFQRKLAATIVLDPACGSGNFLYISLELLLDLEKEVIGCAAQLGFKLAPQVSVRQLRAIEINPVAFDLAQISVQMGFLQWRRENGFENDATPVLQKFDGFQNEDALVVVQFDSEAGTSGNDALKFYTEREWPKCDVIVSNPPFLGSDKLLEQLGNEYGLELLRVFEDRVHAEADLCCYWIEKARAQIENGHCKRAGLVATAEVRAEANREALKRVQETGNIFFAESDRSWVLDGALVRASMIAFDDGAAKELTLDGKRVQTINSNLTSQADITRAATLAANTDCCFTGITKAGQFEIEEATALEWLSSPNQNGRPNSDVLRPWVNGHAMVAARHPLWIVDAGPVVPQSIIAGYVKPFGHIMAVVKPERDKSKDDRAKEHFWIHKRPCAEMRSALSRFERCVAVAKHSKHLVFCWLNTVVLPDESLYVFARGDDAFLGVLSSRIHEVWVRAQMQAHAHGTQGRERESGIRYTATTCFETFPFPFADDMSQPPATKKSKPSAASGWEGMIVNPHLAGPEEKAASQAGQLKPAEHRTAIATAARELNELRDRWLDPFDMVAETILEFPGSVNGLWGHYVHKPDKNGIGKVHYPRLEPRSDECVEALKERTFTNLYNERPAWLDVAHKKLDAAVTAAYGWPANLDDEQILEKLLALNLVRAAEEAKTPKAKKAR